MSVSLYARVSTSDKDQDPETQLMAMRDYCDGIGWAVHRGYVDRASANDLAGRTAWRELQDDAAKRRFQAVVVWNLDRAFRSVKHMNDTLPAWEMAGVSFTSQREHLDTSTPYGRLLADRQPALAVFKTAAFVHSAIPPLQLTIVIMAPP